MDLFSKIKKGIYMAKQYTSYLMLKVTSINSEKENRGGTLSIQVITPKSYDPLAHDFVCDAQLVGEFSESRSATQMIHHDLP